MQIRPSTGEHGHEGVKFIGLCVRSNYFLLIYPTKKKRIQYSLQNYNVDKIFVFDLV